MKLRKNLLIAVGVVVMLASLGWQLLTNDGDTTNPADPTATTDEAGSDRPEDYFDQDDPTNPTADDNPEARNVATPEELQECVPVQNGFGVEMREWGNVRLPYADRWPTNTPGTPVDCAPDTNFGGAIVAAHSLFLDELAPEYIPEIARDEPARQARIDKHSGAIDPDGLPHVCWPVGWNRSPNGIRVWRIFTRCDDGPIEVTSVSMIRLNGQWLIDYTMDATIRTELAEEGTEYYPFEGGD